MEVMDMGADVILERIWDPFRKTHTTINPDNAVLN
jgi:hypothetical protein